MLRLVAVLGIIVAGCVRYVDPGAGSATCDGTRYVVIANEWSRPVEVYVYPGPGARMRIGTVLSHTTEEFKLPKRGGASLYTENRSGRRISVRPGFAEVPVAASYVCR